jgi:hypothetical protein
MEGGVGRVRVRAAAAGARDSCFFPQASSVLYAGLQGKEQPCAVFTMRLPVCSVRRACAFRYLAGALEACQICWQPQPEYTTCISCVHSAHCVFCCHHQLPTRHKDCHPKCIGRGIMGV